MADQKRWFKVWTSLAVDMDHLPNEVVGVWTRLGCRAALVGTSGEVTFAGWAHLARFWNVTVEHAQELAHMLPSVVFEEGKSRHGDLTVTFKNWTQYQEDSTQAERAKASRYKRRGEERRKEERRGEGNAPPLLTPIQGGSDTPERRIGTPWSKAAATRGQQRKIKAGSQSLTIPAPLRPIVDAYTAGFKKRFNMAPVIRSWDLDALADLVQLNPVEDVLKIVEGCLRAGGTAYMEKKEKWTLRNIADEWNALVVMERKGDLR